METPQYMPTNAHVEFVGVFVMNVEGGKDPEKLFYTGLVVVLTKLEICVSIVAETALRLVNQIGVLVVGENGVWLECGNEARY